MLTLRTFLLGLAAATSLFAQSSNQIVAFRIRVVEVDRQAGSLLAARSTAAESASIQKLNPDTDLTTLLEEVRAGGAAIRSIGSVSLAAVNGQSAKMLAGENVAIPVLQGSGAVSIRYQTFGAELTLLPTAAADGSLRLTAHQAVTTFGSMEPLNGFQIPSLSTRTSDATLDLSAGQSFWMSGVVDDGVLDTLRKTRGFGERSRLMQILATYTAAPNTQVLLFVTPEVMSPSL